MRAAVLSVMALVALATGAPAQDEAEVAHARSDFEAIVRHEIPRGGRAGGPSLTALVRTLLARGSNVVRRVEAEAWGASKREDSYAHESQFEIEKTIRFLH